MHKGNLVPRTTCSAFPSNAWCESMDRAIPKGWNQQGHVPQFVWRTTCVDCNSQYPFYRNLSNSDYRFSNSSKISFGGKGVWSFCPDFRYSPNFSSISFMASSPFGLQNLALYGPMETMTLCWYNCLQKEAIALLMLGSSFEIFLKGTLDTKAS